MVIEFATVFAEYGGQRDSERREFVMHIPTEELLVEVFDNQDQDTSLDDARRLDPLVFDLNRDGTDTTDGTQGGNGLMDGETVLFDIDPSRESVSDGVTISGPSPGLL